MIWFAAYYLVGVVILCFELWFMGSDLKVDDLPLAALLVLGWPIITFLFLIEKNKNVVLIRGRK